MGTPRKIRSAVGWRYLREKHAVSGHPSFPGKTAVASDASTVVSSAELMFFLNALHYHSGKAVRSVPKETPDCELLASCIRVFLACTGSQLDVHIG